MIKFSGTQNKCLLVYFWSFSSNSRIFHSYGNATITGEGLQSLAYAQHLQPLNREPSKHMTSKGRWVLVDFWSRRHINNIQRHSDVKMIRLINVGFWRQYDVATSSTLFLHWNTTVLKVSLSTKWNLSILITLKFS